MTADEGEPVDDGANLGHAFYADHPDRVRRRIAAEQAAASVDAAARAEDRPGRWCVFETIAADGSLAVGVTVDAPGPGAVMVVYECLSEAVAKRAAGGLVAWHRCQGRTVT